MRFADIVGNDGIKRCLVNMADTGRVAHAMLLYENDGGCALAFAIAYAQYLNCPHRHDGDSCGECPSCRKISKLIHSDVHYVFPTNSGTKSGDMASGKITSDFYLEDWRTLVLRNPYFLERELMVALGLESKSWDVNVAEAKSIIEKLSFSQVEARYKTVIFYLPEKLNDASANKLLKIVEEPPENTVFLFITHDPGSVLQTIFSRCQSLRINPLSREEIRGKLLEMGYSPEQVGEVPAVCRGSLGEALHSIEEHEDQEMFMGLFTDLMNALMSSDLMAAQSVGEEVADMKKRERQKSFCVFLSECMRKIYLLQSGLPEVAFIPESQKNFFQSLAAFCGKGFAPGMLRVLDRAVYYINRNVSQKILFCDLVNRMFVNIKN